MTMAHDPNSPESPRTLRHLPRVRAALAPERGRGDGGAWDALLADDAGDPAEALRVSPRAGFGTVCASLLALGAGGGRIRRFCPGPPGTTPAYDLPAGSTPR